MTTQDSLIAFYRLLARASPAAAIAVIGITAASGLLLAELTRLIAQLLAEETTNTLEANVPLHFGLCLFAFMLLSLLAALTGAGLSNRALDHVSEQIMEAVPRANLRQVDALTPAGIIAGLTAERETLAIGLSRFLSFVRGSAVVTGCMMILILVQPLCGALLIVTFSLGNILGARHGAALQRANVQLHRAQGNHRQMLGHVLFGLKSLKLHAPRRRALLSTGLVPSLSRLGATQLTARIHAQMQRRPRLYFVAVAPLLPLVVGRIDPTTDIVSAVMMGLVLGMQVLSTGEALQDMQSAIGALNRIQCIEATLRLEADAAIEPQNVFWPECISLVDVGYTHAGSDGFQLGPISFELKRGELLFVTGVNGSGKTTLIRLMTGLYRPQSGHILSDGELVEAGELAQLFVAVFNDFHLIRGIGDLSVRAREQFESTLRRLDLDRVTRLEDGRITAVNLSSGQRRRLALAVALTEERPFYLFDEWAADQDPAFRNWFYATLLPELRAAGHGVVVVTHDDRYFDRCDRHIKLEEGRMATAPVNV